MRLLLVASVVALALFNASGSGSATRPNGMIAFSDRIYYTGDDSWEILVVRPDGTGKRRLTHVGKQLFDSVEPTWSPSGRRIAFTSHSGIFVMDANGQRVRRLTNREGDDAPAWSPQGDRIAFVRDNGIWTIRANGTHPRRLTQARGEDSPAWAPDGRRIVYVRDRTHGLWIIGSRRGPAHSLSLRGSNPSWSPDGHRIVFERASHEVETAGIFVVRPDGSGLRRLTCCGDDPVWSPDGRKIAYRGGGIRVMDANGGHQHVVVSGFEEMVGPAWGVG